MTFLQPAMLWSLLVLGPLAAIYFLEVRPRRKPTTAYFLWERIFQEKRASSLFQRLRDAWSLLLMLLAAAAVCFALARPEWADERKDLILVVDTSASMSTREDRSTRLEQAADIAREIVEGLNGNQLAAVATLDDRLTYRSHLTNNLRDMLDSIDAIRPSHKALDLAALPTGKEWETSDRKYRLVLISDGVFDASALPSHVELVKVGTPRDNLGIVAADLAYIGGSTSRLGFYYQVTSTFAETKEADLSLSFVDQQGHEQLFKVIPLEVKSGFNPPESFELHDAPAGRWLARLDVDDALDEDNKVFLAVAKPRPIRVAVDSTDPYFLENSVHAFSRGDGTLSLVPNKTEDLKQPDVVLAKSTSPEAPNAIILQPAGKSPWWTDLGDEVVPGAARVLVESHPALRHLDAASIPFIGARQLTPPSGAQILVADDKGLPLIYKHRHDGRSAIVVNIDPVAAEFYFSAWFPVLVHSAAKHLAGRENPLAAAYRPGESVPIPGGKDDVITQIMPLSDTTLDADSIAAAEVRGQWYSGTDELGFYRMANTTGQHEFGANLFRADESLVNNAKTQSNHQPLSRGRSPAQWLTLLAIVVLAAESVLYQRRKVG
jgi:hypothetical protein